MNLIKVVAHAKNADGFIGFLATKEPYILY